MANEITAEPWRAPSDRNYELSWWKRVSFESARAATRVIARSASLTGLYRFGRAFATLEYLINYKRRRRFAAHLKRVFADDLSPREQRHHTWRHFVRTRCDKLFYLIFDHLPRERVFERFEIVNRHLITDAIEKGHGAYVAMSHQGAHHVVALLMASLGYQVAVGRDENVGAMRRFIQRKYECKSLERAEFFFSNTYPRKIYRYFQRNYLVGSALDVSRVRSGHLKTINATIHGESRPILIGPMQIAMRCGAPILQAFVISGENYRYVLEFQGPLVDPTQHRESKEVLAEAVQTYANNLERFGKRWPCHVSKI